MDEDFGSFDSYDETLFADDYNVFEEQQVFLDGVAGEFDSPEDTEDHFAEDDAYDFPEC